MASIGLSSGNPVNAYIRIQMYGLESHTLYFDHIQSFTLVTLLLFAVLDTYKPNCAYFIIFKYIFF